MTRPLTQPQFDALRYAAGRQLYADDINNGNGNRRSNSDPIDSALAAEKRARRLRREGKDAEAIEAYEDARELYAETGRQYVDEDVMRAIRRCDAIVSNIRHPKEKRPPATTQRPDCLSCGKPLRRYKFDGKAFDDGTLRDWGDYGDNRFCTLTCGWQWACAHAPLPKKGRR